ncbi:MAG: nucleoside 2-deoxyribosyltransferase [Planctomycetota bacterium]
MASVEAIKELDGQLSAARRAAEEFLRACHEAKESGGDACSYSVPDSLVAKGREVSRAFHGPLVRLGALVPQSSMFGNADIQVVQQAVRRIDAALRLRLFEEWDPEVLHDEGTVLGVRPAGFSEDRRINPKEALAEVDDALDQVYRRLGVLIAAAEAAGTTAEAIPAASAGSVALRPGTAFILMMMDPARPELEDVNAAIREEFERVGIRAIRADDIEHSGEITHRILEEIRNAEFLIADLTGERPSVYYEIGYAHAIGKDVILYRKRGERLHFDLAIHNCPEYANLTELREKLRKRLAAMPNRHE